MCAGAAVLARIPRVVWGESDPLRGGGLSRFRILQTPELNHRAEVAAGVLEGECTEVLREFFRRRREENRSEESGVRSEGEAISGDGKEKVGEGKEREE